MVKEIKQGVRFTMVTMVLLGGGYHLAIWALGQTVFAAQAEGSLIRRPDGTVVGYPPLVDDPAVFPSFLAVPEEPGSHVVLLDGETVLMSASAPRTRALLEQRGLRVVAVDLTEFEKLEGCVTCLSVRLRG